MLLTLNWDKQMSLQPDSDSREISTGAVLAPQTPTPTTPMQWGQDTGLSPSNPHPSSQPPTRTPAGVGNRAPGEGRGMRMTGRTSEMMAFKTLPEHAARQTVGESSAQGARSEVKPSEFATAVQYNLPPHGQPPNPQLQDDSITEMVSLAGSSQREIRQPKPDTTKSPRIDLPPATYEEVDKFTPDEVVNWLDRVDYFRGYGLESDIVRLKGRIIDNYLSGKDILHRRHDHQWLMPFLPAGPAYRLGDIVRGLYHVAGIFLYPSNDEFQLIISQQSHCLASHKISCLVLLFLM